MTEPIISIGIVSAKNIAFELKGDFLFCGNKVSGEKKLCFEAGKITFDELSFDEIIFEPKDDNSSFVLKNVMIGIEFHWQQTENQEFRGALKFIVEDNQITAINLIHVEEYLTSVISSEMSANASLELLKAHAVISRSWLLANLKDNLKHKITNNSQLLHSDSRIIKWYERDAHTAYDVCADDHCQRYQGITRSTNPVVFQAIKETYGETLMFNNEICDTRFSKCCGGASESFENCWADEHHDYLTKVIDCEEGREEDLSIEENARKWISTEIDAFCNTKDKQILSQVLNNYDQSTSDFFRWKTVYTAQEISDIVKKRSGIDFGIIIDLIPVRRGESGRIVELQIVGEKQTVIVGKELEIRKWLSDTHLYSSAFVVEKTENGFTLHGSGWGHGVGLCQIGAAVMGEQGYNYQQILAHYFRNTYLERIY
jgi:SpoIID/LytB domain